MEFPRLVMAALRGGSGKTILSIGIISQWKKLGKSVVPFKKGPDYIDAGWLALAAGRPCFNLDTFLVKADLVRASFIAQTRPGDFALIEGNRGLYDGIDLSGSTSTAELAKLLGAPVILCLDCTKSTRTMAAAVLGCLRFDPEVQIKGVILNRIAGSRHEQILRQSVEHHCGIPVLGAVPKLKKQNFPERHMGLVPTPEHDWAGESIAAAAQMAARFLDMEALSRVAAEAPPVLLIDKGAVSTQHRPTVACSPAPVAGKQKPRIGIIKDSAFQFYYPENIEALVSAGADTVFLSPLEDKPFPVVDALYIGGGFPETHAERLAENIQFKEKIRLLVEKGLPIYAECGGLMYLGEALALGETTYPMVGILPVVFGFSKKPQGHGYTVAIVEGKNPYFPVGTEVRGHEFHYSKVLKWDGDDQALVFSMKKGAGFSGNKDGVSYKNVLATYTHIHALGMSGWADALVRNACSFKRANGRF
ncbi:MAG: cobyrinate a,c-diamide synthase [Thermodesulfobacteriota bacterium]